MNSLKRYFKALADLLLPRMCVVCGRRLNVDEKHLCLNCLADFPYTYFWKMKHNPMADRFNATLQRGLEDTWIEEECKVCSLERYAYAAALFFYRDEGGYKRIPYRIKYHGDVEAGRFFGHMLGARLKDAPWSEDVDMVIPVPLHWRRQWSRGYNQAEIIAEEVAAKLGVAIRTDILKRVRQTKTQTRLDITGKTENVRNAFTAKTIPRAKVRHILIIDDVFTSGSTVVACFEALRTVFPPSVRISVATLGFVGN